MTKAFEKSQIVHLAKLASLSLSDEELLMFERDLASIVGHVETLLHVDVENVPPTLAVLAHGGAPHPMREDTPRASLSHEDAVRAAPKEEDGGFAVPTFVES